MYRKIPNDIKYDIGETEICELKCPFGKRNEDCYIREGECLFHGKDTSKSLMMESVFLTSILCIVFLLF